MKILILLSFIIACIEACWWKKEEPARPVQRRPVPARLPPVKTKMGKKIRLACCNIILIDPKLRIYRI